jgi:hypothetical protein
VINYTDYHEVDEDMRAIVAQGGSWWEDGGTGVAMRCMNNSPTSSIDYVASICRHSHIIFIIIRICILSTKIGRLYLSKVDAGTTKPGQVSRFEIYMTLLLLDEILLLRRTSEMCIYLYGFA